jgi:hypothetical protein
MEVADTAAGVTGKEVIEHCNLVRFDPAPQGETGGTPHNPPDYFL